MGNQLGRWIEKECKRRGWSQRQLAQEAGISQAPISRIINKTPQDQNEKICGEKVAKALAKAFGANPIFVLRLARILKPPPSNRNFSTWLTGELVLRQLTPEQLAEKTGLDEDVIGELTKGIPPSFEIADRLADALGLDPTYIQQLAGLLPPGEDALRTEEIQLLKDYRLLSEGGQKVARDMLHSLRENFGYPEEIEGQQEAEAAASGSYL